MSAEEKCQAPLWRCAHLNNLIHGAVLNSNAGVSTYVEGVVGLIMYGMDWRTVPVRVTGALYISVSALIIIIGIV